MLRSDSALASGRCNDADTRSCGHLVVLMVRLGEHYDNLSSAQSTVRWRLRVRVFPAGYGTDHRLLCPPDDSDDLNPWCVRSQLDPLTGLFLHGDAFAIDWSDFDALYLYNPFELPPFPDRADVEQQASSYELLYQKRVPVVGLDLVDSKIRDRS